MRLVNITEIAGALGVSRQAIFAASIHDPDFPRPVLDAPRRRLWDMREVDDWRKVRSQRPARKGRAE